MENTILYECMWDFCDYQFKDLADLIEHLTIEPDGHVQQAYKKNKRADERVMQCLWYNCPRIKRNPPHFRNVSSLVRHIKQVHVKEAEKNVLPENRNKNYAPSKRIVANSILEVTNNLSTEEGTTVSDNSTSVNDTFLWEESSDSDVEIIKELKVNLDDHNCDLCCEGLFLANRLMQFGGISNTKLKYVCEICDKGYKYKSGLDKHLKSHIETGSHEGVKSKSSPLNSMLNSSYVLNSSNASNASFNSPTTYTCDICSKVYLSRSGLKKHLRKHSIATDISHSTPSQKRVKRTSM